ncbi:MAG: prepilin-type N-terminal cleavage/methylation domain-containing protein [Candidatus Paceibacterota bacterium]|jgi:Tfp pilus assembly protein PilE
MKKNYRQNKTRGFTLIEALFAVFILTLTITSFMGIVAQSLFSARYARDEITASYLLQEVVDYIRNDRDTSVILKSGDSKANWEVFVKRYEENCSAVNSPNGCYFDVLIMNAGDQPQRCEEDSCYLYYNDNPEGKDVFYNHEGKGEITSFQRHIFVDRSDKNPEDEISIRVIMNWKNGGLVKTKSLEASLLRWQ